MYDFRVRRIIRAVDADTIDAEIDLGFGIRGNFRFRLALIDAPEVYGKSASAEGSAAKAAAEAWLRERDGRLIVHTYKGAAATVGIGDGAFGRWLAAFTDGEDDLASYLTREGHVKGIA